MQFIHQPAKLPVQSMPGTVALLDGFAAAPDAAVEPLVKPQGLSKPVLAGLGILAVAAGIAFWRKRGASR